MRKRNGQPDADTALSDEAIEWIVRLHSGHAAPADRAAFGRWRSLSPAHERAALEAESIWQGVGAPEAGLRETAQRRLRVTRRTVIGGLAAIGGGIALERSGAIPPRLFADHWTGTGEQRTVTLPDGSSVALNAATALSVDYDTDQRRLILYQGQAVFSVAPAPDRPFLVEAEGGTTRALGTVFDVDIRTRAVVVSVVEGTVSVSSGGPGQDSVAVGADQRVSYAPGTGVGSIEPADGEAATAWRRGKLIFNHRPLGDVVAEIERHRSGVIVIADPALRGLAVTGVFDLRDPDAILGTIEETLPVRITRLPLVTILR
ncbi:FecR domain-containing protein [Ancylobacter sp. IITR112]|uniref:FecR family protein n=1 Tax=Ancylobacter sp. IITR112 TaxID=3138073 RepID=UPI00352A507C